MASITDKTVTSKYQPKSTNVIWVDTSLNPPVEKHFLNGKWRPMSGVTDYNDIKNKPTINGVELDGNKTSSDLGVATSQQGTKADTAYQKPSSGIPQSDLSSDVQSQLNKHFKGWFDTLEELKVAHTATDGDSAYVKDASPATTWSIYVYDSTASSDNYWTDSGTDADTSNVQTFASSQEVNEVHIVNDLTTGGVDDVLSAEQGKIIADTTMELVESNNILNPSTIIVGKMVRSDTGDEYDIPSSMTSIVYGCTDFIEITDAGLVLNYASRTYGAIGCPAVLYKEDKTRYTNKANSDFGVCSVNPSDYAKTFKYVRFNLAPQSLVPQGENYAIYRQTTIRPYAAWFEPYYSQKQARIDNGTITVDKFHDTVEESVSKNLCDSDDCYFGNDKYINRSDGSIGTYTDNSLGGYTGYIPIDKYGLAFSNVYFGGNVIGGAVYNEQKQYIRSAGDSGIVEYQEGDAFVRFTLGAGATASNVMVNKGNIVFPYVPYEGYKTVISPNILPNTENEVENILLDKKIYSSNLDLLVPNRFYYVKGDTCQLFYKGIVRAIGLENRYVKPTCEIGVPYRRYIQFDSTLSTSVGDKNISFKVYDDNGNILGNAVSKIKVVNQPTSPSSEKHVLCVGSSTTAGGGWVCEAQRRLLASDGTPQGNSISNISFVGSRSATKYGQTSHFEAHSGWAWYHFATKGVPAFRFYLSGTGNQVVQGNQYTNNGHVYTVIELNTIDGVETIKCSTDANTSTPTASGTLTPISGATYPPLTFTSYEQDAGNPFWDDTNNKLDFTSYVNNYCNGYIDIVYTVLGVNMLFSGVDTQEVYVRRFIEALHAEYPNCVIILATDALPSMVDMMPGYGASDDNYSNTYRVICEMHKVFEMYKKLELEYTTRDEDPIQVEFESWCAQVDSDYNVPLEEKNVNTRNSDFKEYYAGNTIHPGEKGYLQMADAAYRSIVAHLCQ